MAVMTAVAVTIPCAGPYGILQLQPLRFGHGIFPEGLSQSELRSRGLAFVLAFKEAALRLSPEAQAAGFARGISSPGAGQNNPLEKSARR